MAAAPLARASDEAAGPCKADREKFCKNVEAGGGRVARCMKEHKDELSKECKDAARERWMKKKAREPGRAVTPTPNRQ